MECEFKIIEYRLDILENILIGIGGVSTGMLIACLIVIYINHRNRNSK